MPQQRKFQLLAGALALYALATLSLVMFFSHSTYTPTELGSIEGSTLLPNMQDIADIPTRKQTFIQLITPMIAQKNSALLEVRKLVLEMQARLARGETLTHVQKGQLQRLVLHYKIKNKKNDSQNDLQQALTTAQKIEQLLLRIDVIPASMVIAQAAAESGWGTSRFAQQAQNLFGQWCYTKGCGLIPKRRSKGAAHEVRKFSSLEQAVNAYYRNINTHRTYRDVRTRRAALRQADKRIGGLALIPGLTGYSSRGQVYVDEISELIKYNKLDSLDTDY
ncbi:glucosaminidase domain-containing protein [Gilvimarinus polysaccharolyticus]|uniref:glucosaminidase domain-containing protein n=1 Tax=Gilvimarinus polysaccharolyticus TaxID=863921 RepID=UPI0006735F34|nr:glucosaminidase domain-containing protein [Gilvimarinus polysaccharolyticus]